MKTIQIFAVVVLAGFCLTGCVSTTKFTYTMQTPVVAAKKVQSKSAILFAVKDLRPNPDVIGTYFKSSAIVGKAIKSSELNLSNSFLVQFKDVLVKNGFSITEDAKKYDLALTLSIRRFNVECRDNLFEVPINASCCIRISLKSGADNKELYLTEVCGVSEKKGSTFAWKKGTLESLTEATDNALSKILNETELVNKINGYTK